VQRAAQAALRVLPWGAAGWPANGRGAPSERATSVQTEQQIAQDRSQRERERRRAEAQAELRAAQLEEERERAEQAAAQARLAEHRAQLDALEEWQRRQGAEERQRGYERWDAAHARLKEIESWQPAPVLPSRAEIEADLAQLERFLDRHNDAEQDRLRAQTDADLSRCIYEPGYRRRWLARHPGGVDQCSCDGCRAYRREPPR
jgi:hypothetical protein